MPSTQETVPPKVRSAPCLSGAPVPPVVNGNSEARAADALPSTSSSTSTASTRARGQTATIDDFQCPICMDTFINVCETNCSHRFCHHCLRTWFHQRRSQVCPSCRTAVHEVRALPDMDARVERYVSQRFTEAQKTEREAQKRLRVSQESFRSRYPDVRAPDSDDEETTGFRIEIPMIEIDTDGMEDPEAYDNFVQAIQDNYATIRNNISGARLSTTLSVDSSGQTPIYLNATMRGRPIFVIPSPPSSAEPAQAEDEVPLEPEYPHQSPTAFEGLEIRLNSFERQLRLGQEAYNQLMDFQLHHDPDGIFVRRIYDRFNALGLIEENQREQWASSSPFMPPPPPTARRPATMYSRLRSDMTTAMSSSSATSSRPNTEGPEVFPSTPSNGRIPLDNTGWLSYYHRNRHTGGTDSPEGYNGWEHFVDSNPPLEAVPPTRADNLDTSYEPSNPPTPVTRTLHTRRSDRRRFSSPNYYSAGYHSFMTPSQARSDDDPPATGDSTFGTPLEDSRVRSMPEEPNFRCRHYTRNFSAEVEDEDSEAPPRCDHTYGHPCSCHIDPDSDLEYDYENNNTRVRTGYEDSQDDDDEDRAVQIEIMVRPTAPPRRRSPN